MEFKVGDRVKIPKTKHNGNFLGFLNEISNYDKEYLYIVEIMKDNVSLGKTEKVCLGYDNFQKGEIELYEEEFPEKWSIQINQENQKIVGEWFLKRFDRHKDISTHAGYCGTYFSFPVTEGHRSFPAISQVQIPWDYTEITFDQFKKHILKESTTMKNLLETEFVIENCTLSQRLAIKAYCDEKNIKYASKYTFEDKVFDALVWDKTEFLNYETGRKDKRNRVTFSELIQFLDKYKPEPEFKVGDHIFFLKEFDDSEIGTIGCITKIGEDHYEEPTKGWISYKRENHQYACGGFRWEGNGYFVGEHFRHATPEEIERWKEENEIKLPRIDGNDGQAGNIGYLKWGCTKISVSTIKELIEAGINHLTIKNCHITQIEISQIKKFIEFNKL